jgi:hypothetical protein
MRSGTWSRWSGTTPPNLTRAALLRQGKAEEAENVFRKDLGAESRNAFSLFGLLQAVERQKRRVYRMGEEGIRGSMKHSSTM